MATNRLLAWNFETPDINRLISPIQQGVRDYRQIQQQGIENERQNKLLGFQEQRLGMDRERMGMEREQFEQRKQDAVRERAGNLALLTLQETDPARRAQRWSQFMATHPDAKSLDQKYHDPSTGPMAVLADAKMGQQYLDYQMRQQSAANEKARLGLAYSADARAAAESKARMSQYENMTPQARAEAASTLGLTPGTPNYNAFIATGKYAPPEAAVKPFPLKPGEEVAGINTQTGQEAWRVRGGEQNKPDDKFNEEIAKSQAAQFDEAVKSYPATQANLGKIQIMQQLSGLIGQPGIANTIANSPVGRAARAVGLAPEQMATLESWTAMVNQMVPSQRPPGSGTMSDRDVELFKSSLPMLAATKQGRDFILAQMNGIAEYDAQRAMIANEVVTGRLNRRVASDRLMALPNPLAGVSENLARFGIGGPGPQQAVPQGGGGIAPGSYVYDPATGQLVPRGGASFRPGQDMVPPPGVR